MINSSLSLHDARNADIMAAVMELEERDYSFLSHDSYFCADEHNLLLNPLHPRAPEVRVDGPEIVTLDPRLAHQLVERTGARPHA